MPDAEVKTLRTDFEIKSVVPEQRIIEGYAAVGGNLDRVGDIIDHAANVKAAMTPPGDIGVFIGHQSADLPIGRCLELRAVDGGLWTKTYVFPTSRGDDLLQTAKALQDAGSALGLSIGYRTNDYTHERRDGKMARILKSYQLAEYSYAAKQVIANPRALVTSVKSAKTGAPGSFDQIRQELMSELIEMFPDAHPSIEDLYSDHLVYSLGGSDSSVMAYYQASYGPDADGDLAIGDPTPVAPNWTPMAEAGDAGDQMDASGMGGMMGMGKALNESSATAGGYMANPDMGAMSMPCHVEASGGQFWVVDQAGKRVQGYPTRAEAEARIAAMSKTIGQKAVWSTAEVNNLPDSSFLYIEPGGQKDSDGRTVPRTNRHFPYKGPDGAIDLPHLRNAIARIPQTGSDILSQTQKDSLQARARHLLDTANAGKTIESIEVPEWQDGAALKVRGVAYELIEVSETIATELKAMALLGSDTKQNGRLRSEVRQKVADLAGELGRLVRHAELIDEEQDGAAQVALFRSQLQLLEV